MDSKGDEDWVTHPAKAKPSSSSEDCIIHCTNSSDELVTIQSLESWKTLLNAATIRQHHAVLQVASTLAEGVVPDIKYHRKCRSTLTMKKLLDNIKKKNEVIKILLNS